MAEGFVSEAQRTKWQQLLTEGRVTADQYAKRAALTPTSIPERAAPRKRTVGASRAPNAAKNLRY